MAAPTGDPGGTVNWHLFKGHDFNPSFLFGFYYFWKKMSRLKKNCEMR